MPLNDEDLVEIWGLPEVVPVSDSFEDITLIDIVCVYVLFNMRCGCGKLKEVERSVGVNADKCYVVRKLVKDN